MAHPVEDRIAIVAEWPDDELKTSIVIPLAMINYSAHVHHHERLVVMDLITMILCKRAWQGLPVQKAQACNRIHAMADCRHVHIIRILLCPAKISQDKWGIVVEQVYFAHKASFGCHGS